MVHERFSRTARLLGDAAIEKLHNTHVLLFGVGGVGGYVLEALVRAGIGEIPVFVEEGGAAALIAEVAPDYIVDAIDTVSAKVGIIRAATASDIPIISSMGTGNKLDPTKLTVTDISKTSICPLARAMRTRLRREGILHLDVLFSTELPLTPLESEEENGRHLPASTPFVPAAAGLVIASHVVRKILEI